MVNQGDTIEIVSISDQYTDLETGETGTVQGTNMIPGPGGKEELKIFVDWGEENGSLPLLDSQDQYKIIDNK